MTPHEKEQRARAAKEALANPAIKAALDELYVTAVEVWASTDLSETSKREITYFQMLGSRQILQQLENWSRETKKDG